MTQRLVVIAVSLMMAVCCLSACTVYYKPDQGEHRQDDEQRRKDRGEHRQDRGGVVIEIPGKKPEVKPMPN